MSVRTRKATKDAKTLAAVQNRYDAAGTGRRMKGWTPPSTGPQRAVDGLSRIRDRSRDAARNDWAGASAGQKWTTTLIGTGITPRWAKERHTAVWTDFVPQADADDVLDAYGMQALAARAFFDSGEVFLRRRWRDAEGPLAVPVQFQLIESDYCPIFDADVWPGMPAGNTIRQGIERNKYGRRVAYWLHREHPGDGRSGTAMMDLLRVPAADISHVFEPLRPGQLRGVSPMASVLARIRSGGDFEDAVLDRQKLANLFTVFFTKQLPTDWENLKVDPDTGLPVDWTRKGQPMAGLEPGAGMELLPGEGVTFANPPEAGVSFPDYLRSLHLGTAAAGGLPYELLSGDIRDIGDRTLRVLIQEFRRFAKQRQWHLVIPKICQRPIEWVADAAVLSGRLRASERDVFARPEWAPNGWDYIHPVQDVEGKKLAIEAGITSRSAVVAETGEDPRTVQDQREADRLDDKARGLLPLPAPGAAGKPAAPPAPAGPSAVEQALAGVTMQLDALQTAREPDPVMAQMLGGVLAMMNTMQSNQAALAEGMQALALALANRPLETHVAPPAVTNNVTVEPTPVAVTVEPTPVAITNNVEAPVLQVEATLHMPDRRTETEVQERDENGNVVRAVHLQTTVLQ